MKSNIHLFVLCCLFCTLRTYSQTISFNVTNGNSVEFVFNLPQYSVRDTVLPAGYGVSRTFSYIQMDDDDFGLIDSVGLPLLPQLTIDVHMPVDAMNFSIALSSCQYTYFYVTNPIMPALSDISVDSIACVFNMDSVHYASNNPFMSIGATIMNEYIVFGKKGLSVAINPFEYEPANGRIKVLAQGTVTISYIPNPSISMVNPNRSTVIVERYLSSFFSNYPQNPVRSTDKENYLIITAPLFENAISAFADYKENLGYNVNVVSTNVTGTSAASIKNYIQNQYNTNATRPEYVLLVGGTSFIPAFEGINANDDNPVSDLRYSLLEGLDSVADVFLGRFPANSVNELMAMINKTFFMEMNLSGMTKKATFIAGEDDNSWVERQFEKGHNHVVRKTFSALGFQCDKLYQPNNTQVTQNLSGNPLFFIYSGHGAITKWAGKSFTLFKNDLSNATNTYYPFVFSFSCWTGSYADTGGICNSWMKLADKGAVTYFGSSVTTRCHSDLVIEKKIFDSRFSTDVPISFVIDHGMNEFRLHFWGTLNMKRVYRYLKAYNLLGDPSLIMGGIDCFYNYIFTHNVSVPSGGNLNIQADHLIRNDNTLTVSSGANVYLQAGDEIILSEGFHAAIGSDFEAVIAPCSGRAAQNMGSGSPLLLSGYGNMPSRQDSSETVITEPNARQKLRVYPNPVSGMLHIQLPDAEKGIARVTVCDLLGRVVLQKENLSQPEMEVSSLTNGMYLLQLRLSDGTNLTAKFVKN